MQKTPQKTVILLLSNITDMGGVQEDSKGQRKLEISHYKQPWASGELNGQTRSPNNNNKHITYCSH